MDLQREQVVNCSHFVYKRPIVEAKGASAVGSGSVVGVV